MTDKEKTTQGERKLAYVIFKCNNGWCYQRAVYNKMRECWEPTSPDNRPHNVNAFSRLGQVFWYIRKIRKERGYD